MSRRLSIVVLALAGCNTPGPMAEVDEAQMVCAKGATIKGVDVSHYDGAIDWGKVKAAGIDFAFMKATETTNFVDPEFAANWKYAQMNGVVRGAYHFFRASADPVAQADFFLATMGPSLPGDLPPTLDLETLDGTTAATTAAGALKFMQRVQQKTGRTPIVYTSASFMSTLGNPTGWSGYTLWVAHWTNMCPNLPPQWATWTFWQNSATGTVDGIPSTKMVDLDEFNGTLSDLHGFVGGGTPDGGAGDGGTGVGDGGTGSGDGGAGTDMGGGGVVPPRGPGGGVIGVAHSGCSFSLADNPRGALVFCALVILFLGLRRRG